MSRMAGAVSFDDHINNKTSGGKCLMDCLDLSNALFFIDS